MIEILVDVRYIKIMNLKLLEIDLYYLKAYTVSVYWHSDDIIQ